MRSIFGILISLALGMVLALLSSGCALTGKCIVINEWSPWQQGSNEITPGVRINDVPKKEVY